MLRQVRYKSHTTNKACRARGIHTHCSGRKAFLWAPALRLITPWKPQVTFVSSARPPLTHLPCTPAALTLWLSITATFSAGNFLFFLLTFPPHPHPRDCEMALGLKTLVGLPEDLSSIPGTHVVLVRVLLLWRDSAMTIKESI